ncbi:MAG: tripartite tricarboxylate transporter substrate binding protein [Burkholderiaceae bacterium]
MQDRSIRPDRARAAGAASEASDVYPRRRPRRWAAWAGASLVALATWAGASGPAGAQTYPSHPVRLIAPYAAGGPTDAMARLLAGEMAKTLGQPVVVENRPGASGAIGADVVAKSAPDGYTVCFCTTGPTVLMPLLEPKLPYSPRDLAPVGLVHRVELSILLGPKLPVTNIAELVAYAKANPGKVSFSSPGAGSPNHMAGELLKTMGGIDMVHIPYKGEQPAMVDLIGGQADMMVGSVFIGEPQVKAGKVRMIAVTGPARAPRYPEIPTVADTISGYEATSHVGLHVPAGTPADIIDKLNAAMKAAVAQPNVTEKMLADGITPLATGVQEYEAYLQRETEKWKRVIKQNGIRLD